MLMLNKQLYIKT